jgi:hypothetical protein
VLIVLEQQELRPVKQGLKQPMAVSLLVKVQQFIGLEQMAERLQELECMQDLLDKQKGQRIVSLVKQDMGRSTRDKLQKE